MRKIDLHEDAVDEGKPQCYEDIEASEDDTVDGLLEDDGRHDRSVPVKRLPGEVRQCLHVVDRVHLNVLVRFVELNAAGHAGKILGGRNRVADRLRVAGTTANRICDDE